MLTVAKLPLESVMMVPGEVWVRATPSNLIVISEEGLKFVPESETNVPTFPFAKDAVTFAAGGGPVSAPFVALKYTWKVVWGSSCHATYMYGPEAATVELAMSVMGPAVLSLLPLVSVENDAPLFELYEANIPQSPGPELGEGSCCPVRQ